MNRRVAHIQNPDILQEIASYPSGLHPIQESYMDPFCLVVKGQKEMILTAILKSEFAVYIVPVVLEERKTHGIVTAFFDDFDEPLTITTPLFDDEYAYDILDLLSSHVFDVHFFIFNSDVEVMAWRCLNERPHRVKLLSNMVNLLPESRHLAREYTDKLNDWFARRKASDDRDRILIRKQEAIGVSETSPGSRIGVNSRHGWKESSRYPTIERPDPGEYSEQDIGSMLLRVFSEKHVFLNPSRTDNGREFVDVLVSTPRFIVLIQAKDSPNTEKALQRSISRKKATIESHLKKAFAQLQGSLSYLTSSDMIQVICDSNSLEISKTGRSVIGLVIVKELFIDEYEVYSRFAFDALRKTGSKCFVMDMTEFHGLTFFCRTEERFFGALANVFLHAQKNGQFPRSRFGLVE